MQEAIDDLLDRRAHQPDPIGRTAAWSILAHVAIVAFFVYMPASWRGASNEPPPTVMTISLGGVAGPNNGGMTAMGGRTVQETTPDPIRRAEQPPAAKPPEMALPAPTRRPTPPRNAPRDAVGRNPSRGAEVQEGPARAETGVRGQGFGLATGGGGAGGVQLDVQNFCCPEYLEAMVRIIRSNWQNNQGIAGQVRMRFTITRSGAIENVQVDRPSGFAPLELAAQRALLLSRLPELPAQFPNPALGVGMWFEYSR